MELAEKLVELRKSTGMNRRKFSDYFGIPYRTVQDWELGNRHMPEYLFRLMVYRIEMEKVRENWRKEHRGYRVWDLSLRCFFHLRNI
ncbi:MAG: helix-turn-helix domain-containing protein [Lachnospiraceae bacterium]